MFFHHGLEMRLYSATGSEIILLRVMIGDGTCIYMEVMYNIAEVYNHV